MLVKEIGPGTFFVARGLFDKDTLCLYRKLPGGEIVQYRQGGGAGASAILLTEAERPVQFSNNVEAEVIVSV